MEPEGSLPRLQLPATCSHPEPHRSSPCPHIPLPEDPSYYYPPLIRLVLQIGLFPSGFPTKTLYTRLLSPIRATCPAHLIRLDFITLTILSEEYRSLSSSLCSFPPFPSYLVPFRPKDSPQHPILKHPQPTFLHPCEQPSSTHIQNNRQNYSSAYLNLCIFG